MICVFVAALFIVKPLVIGIGSEVGDPNLPTTTFRLVRADSDSEETSSSSEEIFECRPSGVNGGVMAQDCELLHVDFEVHGRVQGVFFRKHTQEEGIKQRLRGFCRNTSSGTVSGSMEGPRQAVERMKHWLEHIGSPMSII